MYTERAVHPTMAYATLCQEQSYCVNGVCYFAIRLRHPVSYCVSVAAALLRLFINYTVSQKTVPLLFFEDLCETSVADFNNFRHATSRRNLT